MSIAHSVKCAILHEIDTIIDECAFVGRVEDFENDFARYCDAAHCVACSSGTDALLMLFDMASKVFDVQDNPYVLIQSNTFFATAEAAARAGWNTIFCDVGSDGQMRLSDVEAAYSQWPFTVLCVTHMFGRIGDEFVAIANFCKTNNIILIEDAAQAAGTRHLDHTPQVVTGLFSFGAAFSFYPAKNLGAFGDAGAVISSHPNFDVDMARAFVSHGEYKKGMHSFISGTHRMDSIQAAVLKIKLKTLDTANNFRARNVQLYEQFLNASNRKRLLPHNNTNNHLFVLLADNRGQRAALRDYLTRNNIYTGVHYPQIVPESPAFESFHTNCDFSNAKKLAETMVSLPMYPSLPYAHIQEVCEKINWFMPDNK